jgi:hypothetical protein
MAAAHRKVNCYGREVWIKWLERTARNFGVSAPELVARALDSFAEAKGLTQPPMRLDPDAYRRGARRRYRRAR